MQSSGRWREEQDDDDDSNLHSSVSLLIFGSLFAQKKFKRSLMTEFERHEMNEATMRLVMFFCTEFLLSETSLLDDVAIERRLSK